MITSKWFYLWPSPYVYGRLKLLMWFSEQDGGHYIKGRTW
ncbi:hypothetical protein LCGC14_1996620 [marine sediment metagenome]|uniref:Uncharacterized protein n=1 Tax=marine sediment metagenome TaxID=412755 RepID=A0A0F9F4S3_9ZZZZ